MAGLPGVGKSAIADAVGDRLGLAVVSVDPIESAILQAGIDGDQPTGLAAYLVAETLADAVLQSGRGVIVDAVNAVAPAREQWVHLAARRGVELRFVAVECSDPELHRSRLEARERGLAPLEEPTWHAVEQSLDEWEDWSGESGAVARLAIDTRESLEACVGAVVEFVRA
ncbi:ATP-binding protein [Schumannella sp. 10F1B-5-1]|uniref:AAA family ATPase n=1 Tax=Schumannella sp. 10F1B-5-1 TaxID=2590780 RepID=UPI0015E867F2|nr:ATP-binding protein [Schumannella sp. 10F1B-5-1]